MIITLKIIIYHKLLPIMWGKNVFGLWIYTYTQIPRHYPLNFYVICLTHVHSLLYLCSWDQIPVTYALSTSRNKLRGVGGGVEWLKNESRRRGILGSASLIDTRFSRHANIDTGVFPVTTINICGARLYFLRWFLSIYLFIGFNSQTSLSARLPDLVTLKRKIFWLSQYFNLFWVVVNSNLIIFS